MPPCLHLLDLVLEPLPAVTHSDEDSSSISIKRPTARAGPGAIAPGSVQVGAQQHWSLGLGFSTACARHSSLPCLRQSYLKTPECLLKHFQPPFSYGLIKPQSVSILVNSIILHVPAGPQPGSITGAQVMWDNATNVATMVFVQGSSSSSWPNVRAPPCLPTTAC